jgi:HEAT repeat protein
LIGVVEVSAEGKLADELAALLIDRREEIQAAAARLLGDLLPADRIDLLPMLEGAARNPSKLVRRSVVAALHRLGANEARALLLTLCRDDDPDVAAAASASLSDLNERLPQK